MQKVKVAIKFDEPIIFDGDMVMIPVTANDNPLHSLIATRDSEGVWSIITDKSKGVTDEELKNREKCILNYKNKLIQNISGIRNKNTMELLLYNMQFYNEEHGANTYDSTISEMIYSWDNLANSILNKGLDLVCEDKTIEELKDNQAKRLESLANWANNLSGKAKEDTIKVVKQEREKQQLELTIAELQRDVKKLQSSYNDMVDSFKRY